VAIKDKIWKAVEVLKRENVGRQFSLLPTLISALYKHAYDSNFLIQKNEDLYKDAEYQMKAWSSDVQNRLFNCINYVEKEELKSAVEILILDNELVNTIYDREINKDFADLVYNLLKEDGHGNFVFNVGSGLGGFLINYAIRAQEKHYCFKGFSGIDYSMHDMTISKMALALCDDGEMPGYIAVKEDEFEDYSCMCNRGFVLPPFGMKMLNIKETRPSKLYPEFSFTARSASEWVIIDTLLSKVEHNWRVVSVVSGNALFGSVDKAYRTALIKHGLLEGIIELPNGAMPGFAPRLYLAVFSKQNNYVKLLDAFDCIKPVQRKLFDSTLDVELITKKYFSNDCQIKHIDDISKETNLVPSKLLLDKKAVKDGRKLKDIAKVFNGSQYTIKNFESMFSSKDTGYKILTSSDIEDGYVNCDNLRNIEIKPNYKSGASLEDLRFWSRMAKDGDVIIANKSSKIKIAVIECGDNSIIVTGGMLIIRPDSKILNPTFLKIYFESEDGQNTLKKIQKGAVILSINAHDLGETTVPCPSMEKQIQIMEESKSILSTIIAYKDEIIRLEAKLKDLYNKFMEE